MAKITLTIEAENAAELYAALSDLDRSQITAREWADTIHVTPGTESEPEETEEQKTRRRRRTKAEMEEERARQNAAPVSQAKTPDVFAAQIKEVVAEAKAEEAVSSTGTSLADARKVMSEWLAQPGHSAQQLQELLLKHGGAARITDIDPGKYDAVIAALRG